MSNVGALSLMATPKWGDIKQSSGNFSWAKVDGLKIQLVSIMGTRGAGQDSFRDFDPPRSFELGGDTGVVKLNDSISVPAEYDYFTVGKMNPDPRFENEIMEFNKWNFSVSEGQTPYLNILVDTSYVVSCANIAAKLDVNEEPKLPPFTWGLESGKMSDFYKGTDGNFRFSYIPLFTYLSTTADEVLPTGETYASTATANDMVAGDESFNMLTSLITTIAFDSNNEIIAARSRNFGMGVAELQQGWSGFVKSGSAYSMLNGEHYAGAKGDYSDARWLQDRKIEGFERRADFTSVQELFVIDGPDCGKELNDHNNTCLGDGVKKETYWKRIRR